MRRRPVPKKGTDERRWWENIPFMLFMVYWWVLLSLLILVVDPAIIKDVGWPNSYLPFLVILFMAILTTIAYLRKSWLKGIVWAVAVTLYLGLRILGLGHIVNLLLMLGVLVSLEVYWHKI